MDYTDGLYRWIIQMDYTNGLRKWITQITQIEYTDELYR